MVTTDGDEDGDGMVDDVSFWDGGSSSTSTSSDDSDDSDSSTSYSTTSTGGSTAYYSDVTADNYEGEEDLEESSDQSDPYDYESDSSNWESDATDDSDSGSYGVRDYASDVTEGEEGDETTGAVNLDAADDGATLDPNAEVQRFEDLLTVGGQVDGDLVEGHESVEVVADLSQEATEAPDVEDLAALQQALNDLLADFRMTDDSQNVAGFAPEALGIGALVLGALVLG